MSKIPAELESVFDRVQKRASDDQVEMITTEYLVWGLLHEEDVHELLSESGIDIIALESELERVIREDQEFMRSEAVQQFMLTRAAERALQQTALISAQTDTPLLVKLGFLRAVMFEQDTDASELLQRFGLSSFFTGKKSPDSEDHSEISDADEEILPRRDGTAAAQSSETFLRDLVAEAHAGRIDPLIGREEELEKVILALSRRLKNSALLAGDSGVGKTAIAEGLAYRIAHGQAPEELKDFRIYSLDLGSVIAGAKYRGELEERILNVLKSVSRKPKTILFVDELHQLAANGSENGPSLPGFFKTALAAGGLRMIAAINYEELKKLEIKDRAFLRWFQKIDVKEPPIEDAVEILEGLRTRFEEFHGAHFEEGALRAAVELSDRYISNKRLPDKAIDVIDEAGAFHRLRKAKGLCGDLITKTDIEKVVSKLSGVPAQTVTVEDNERLRTLGDRLKAVIFGQDEAVAELTDAIKLSRSGLARPDKPIGSFLLAGPTGVGKTELSKQLAENLGVDFIRFDMSEYMEQFTVSRLIGAPPGYVGYDRGGLLTEAVSKSAYSVVLLDEIEKAHPQIFNVLLQVMDYGSLTDTNGKKVDFRNTVLLMTTNAGASSYEKRSIGFGDSLNAPNGMEEIKKTFSPEFRNRLDAIVHFKPLSKKDISRVVDKFLKELEAQLETRGVKAKFSENLKRYLAENGFDERMGARPMAALIHKTVKKKLADELLFGCLKEGGDIVVDMTSNYELRINKK